MVNLNRYTFGGSSFAIFMFASSFIRGQLLKERICPSKAYSFHKSWASFGKFNWFMDASKSHKSCPLFITGEKIMDVKVIDLNPLNKPNFPKQTGVKYDLLLPSRGNLS